MGSINTVTLVGRLTRDPEAQMTKGDIMYTRFTVACDRNTKDDEADFISCIAWRQSAKYLTDYAQKGMQVGLTGRIQTGKYEKDGVTHYTTDVVADRVTILESKKAKADYPNNGSSLRPADIDTSDGFPAYDDSGDWQTW